MSDIVTPLIGGRYERYDQLGAGGMGVVYHGTDTHTDQPVAIKALKPGVATPEMIARFKREGEILRELNHPNIVTMLEAVQQGGHHYIVMEYVAGGSLADVLDAQGDHPLPIARILQIAIEVTDALTRAHYLNIIHRDIKPANVLLSDEERVRLTDFGLARPRDKAGVTESGVIMGTLEYLSPEVCDGDEADSRTDIWSLGVMLYRLTAGELPFTGPRPGSIISAILLHSPSDLEVLRPDAPLPLVDLIYRMLEKDRLFRIPSVRIVGAELEAIQRGTPIPPPRPTPHRDSEPDTFTVSHSRFATPTPAADAPRHNLPAQLTPFVGREAELTELARLLDDPAARLITILAPGGMGKTRLSLEAARRTLEHTPLPLQGEGPGVGFKNGVYFVPLAPLQSTDGLISTIAEHVNFQFYQGLPPRQQLLDYFREKHMLVIMDNFEHLLDGAGLVTDILEYAPNVKVIATSRERLNLQGETIFRISGMEFPDWETPEDALEYAAVKLFMQSAHRVRPDFELVADELTYVARICRLVEGMPLGILLAAAWVDMLSLEEIADEISHSLDFLETDLRDVPERHRSIRAAIEPTWNRLSPQQQDVFMELSVFRGGFTWQAAQVVTGAELRDLTALVSKSLLQRDPASGRYSIHELLRQYAEDRLVDVGEVTAVRDAHCTYYLTTLHDLEDDLKGRRQIGALRDIAADYDNVMKAWEPGLTTATFAEIDSAAFGLLMYYSMSDFQSGKKNVKSFSLAVEKLDAEEPQGKTAAALGKILACQLYFMRHDTPRYSELFQRCRSLLQKTDQPLVRALALMQPAPAEMGGTILQDQVKDQEEAVAICQEADDQWWEVQALQYLAVYYSELALEYGIAKQLCDQRLRLSQRIGDVFGQMIALGDLGIFALDQQQYKVALDFWESGMALARQLGNRIRISDYLNNIANIASREGQFDKAEHLIQQSLAIANEFGNQHRILWFLDTFGNIKYRAGSYEAARTIFEDCLDIVNHNNWVFSLALVHHQLGFANLALNDLSAAQMCFFRSLESAVHYKYSAQIVVTLVGIAALLARQGQPEWALEILSYTVEHPASDKHIDDEARLLIQLEAELPPDVVAAAKARGKALDLDATVAALLDELRPVDDDDL